MYIYNSIYIYIYVYVYIYNYILFSIFLPWKVVVRENQYKILITSNPDVEGYWYYALQ